MIRQRKLRTGICFLFLAALPTSSREGAGTTVDAGNTYLPQKEVPYENLASPGLRDQFTNYIQILENGSKAIEASKTQLQPGQTLIQAPRQIVDTQAKDTLSRLREIFDFEIRSELIEGIQTDVCDTGGEFAVGARYVGQLESVPIAGTGGFTIVTVDYRMGMFPAASFDAKKVYRACSDLIGRRTSGFMDARRVQC